jgi:general secretion pathway protein H
VRRVARGSTPTSTAGTLINQRGFTLIELAIVVLLLGLVAGLTMPLLSNWGQDDLLGSARRLAGTVRYLYNEAALTRNEHQLIFNLDDGSYQTKVLDKTGHLEPVGGAGKGRKLLGDARFEDIVITSRGRFTTGEVTTLFHPSGWLDETIIHLRDEDGKQLSLRFAPLTGAMDLVEGHEDF